MLEHLPYVAFERDAFIRTAEAAGLAHTRREFFVWLRLHLHRFVPHDLAVCQILRRPAAAPTAHVFNSVAFEPALLGALSAASTPFWTELQTAWLRAGRAALVVDLGELTPGREVQGLRAASVSQLLVHGVDVTARLLPEALFVFARREVDQETSAVAGLSLWLTHLHACAARVLDTEDEAASPTARQTRPPSGGTLTARELQILKAVREDKRTTDIAEQFGLSALTVKNHMRNIMSKLGARSRAHAVAEAMARQLIS